MVLAGTICSFCLVILLIRRRVNFGISLIIGSIFLSLFALFSVSWDLVIQAFLKATIYDVSNQSFVFGTIELAVLMTLIYILASLMQDTGAIAKLIDSLRVLFQKGGTIAVIPAIYGLMPVPGGALFSAPAVEEEGKTFHLSVSDKNFFNVWFRHIWFPIYPISSSILIMADLASLNMYLLIAVNSISFFAMIIIGYLILSWKTGMIQFKKSKKPMVQIQKKKRNKENLSGLKFLLPPVLPLVFSFLEYLGISLFSAFIIGVGFSILLLYFMASVSWEQFQTFFKKALTWKLVAVIAGIMIFREIFEVSEVNVTIYSILEQLPFTPLLVIIVFPLTLGLLTGYLLSGITLSYVLLQPLFSCIDLCSVGLVSILFMSGFVGYLISPIHLCNVLSSEYLKTDTTRMYPLYIPASIVVLLVQLLFVVFILPLFIG
jgi:integral membrane protein (TIGR00529 family)